MSHSVIQVQWHCLKAVVLWITLEKLRMGVRSGAASGRDTKGCTSPDGLRWVDAGCILPPNCFSPVFSISMS